MATNPSPLRPDLDDHLANEPVLSREEAWDLLFSLFGTAGDMYASVGGADAFLRAERASWGEADPA